MCPRPCDRGQIVGLVGANGDPAQEEDRPPASPKRTATLSDVF